MIGRKISVGFGKETVRGTLVAAATWMPKYDVTIHDKKKYINSNQSFGSIAETEDADIIQEWSEGEISGKLRDQSFGYILLATLGQLASAVKETTAYNHTATLLNSNTHPSLSVEVKDDIEQLGFAMAMIDKLKITATVGKYVEISAGFKGTKGVTAATAVSYTNENEFIAKHVIVKVASAIGGLAGATALPISSVELTIDKNLDDDYVFGKNTPNDIYNKSIAISGTIDATYLDLTTFKNAFLAGTMQAMLIDIKNTDVTIGAASNPELAITLSRVSFQDWSRKSANDNLVTQAVKFTAHLDVTTSTMISAVLTNVKTSY